MLTCDCGIKSSFKQEYRLIYPCILFIYVYFADGRQMMSPFAFSRSGTNMAWQDVHSSKLPQTKDFLAKPAKAMNKIPSIVSMFSDDSSGLLTSRSIAAKTIVPGCC